LQVKQIKQLKQLEQLEQIKQIKQVEQLEQLKQVGQALSPAVFACQVAKVLPAKVLPSNSRHPILIHP